MNTLEDLFYAKCAKLDDEVKEDFYIGLREN